MQIDYKFRIVVSNKITLHLNNWFEYTMCYFKWIFSSLNTQNNFVKYSLLFFPMLQNKKTEAHETYIISLLRKIETGIWTVRLLLRVYTYIIFVFSMQDHDMSPYKVVCLYTYICVCVCVYIYAHIYIHKYNIGDVGHWVW